MIQPTRFLLTTFCLFTLSLAAPLTAQETSTETEEPVGVFAETVDVRVINVDVYVTDDEGGPVTDLTAEDFRLFEDGRPVKITNFYAVSGGTSRADQEPRRAESTSASEPDAAEGFQKRDAATETPRQASLPRGADTPATPSVPETQRLQLVVYIDNANIAPLHRNRVFDELRAFLYEHVRPGDRVMLLSYDRSLHMRQPFIGNSQALARALLELETAAGEGSSRASRHEDLMRLIEQADRASAVSGQVRQYAQSVRNDLRFTLDALRKSVDWLAGLDGRKMLLYVSDGLPMSPGRDLFYALQYKFDYYGAMSHAIQFNQKRSFWELTNLANANRVMFYTVDAKGLVLPGGFAAEYRGGRSTADWRSQVYDLRQDNLQNAIRAMAERTGGRAIVNTNDIGPGLERIAQDMNNYYSLGYQPAQVGDGRYHEIEVKVLREDVTVRHREGYRDRPLSTRVANTLEANLRFGEGENPLELRLVMGEAAPHDEGEMLLPVSVKIPLGNLTLIPRENLWVGQVQVFFRTMDPQGGISEMSSDAIDVRIPADEYETAMGQNWSYDAKLIVRRGRQKLAVAVRDRFGAQTSIVDRIFQVGS